MGRASFKVIVVLLTLSGGFANAQISIDIKNNKSPFAYDPVIVIDTQDNVWKGIFIELKGDSITILHDSRLETVAINSLKHLKIFSSRKSRNNMLNMGAGGAFFAQLLIAKRDWQSDRFVQADGLWSHILVGAVGSIAGGLIGLGVDLAQGEREMEYNLQDPQDVARMVKDINQVQNESKLNFYYEIAKVYARSDPANSQIQGSYYEYDKVTLNVFRSLKLTYDITDRIEAGLALYSAAEPNLKYSTYNQSNYGTEEMSNRVYGYYAMAYYDLFGRSGPSSFSMKPGVGIGFVNLDYTAHSSVSVYDPITFTYKTTRELSTLSKTTFSGFLAIDLRFYTLTGVSVSVTGDYVFIPEKTPPSNLGSETGKSFSNFSLGLSLGIHL